MRHISQTLGAIIAVIAIFATISTSFAYADAYSTKEPSTSSKYSFALQKSTAGGKSNSGSSQYTFALQRSTAGGKSSSIVLTKPKSVSGCLAVAVVGTPGVNSIQIVMGVTNFCGSTATGIQWEYSSTSICAGQAYPGPSRSGSLSSLAKGSSYTLANDLWASDCYINRVLVPHTISITGSVAGDLPGGNIGEGLATTEEYTVA